MPAVQTEDVEPASGNAFERDYELLPEVLGEGLNGNVHEAICRCTGRRVAVKSHDKSALGRGHLKRMRAEVEVHRSLDHHRIVRLEGVYESETTLHMVMEKLDGGELFERVLDPTPLREEEVARIAVQLLQAVSYLHACGIVHRDIKMENVVFTERGGQDLKLIDLGYATRLRPGHRLGLRLGTPGYTAPEVLRGISYDEKVDLWSVGSVMYGLLTHEPLLTGESKEVFRNNTRGCLEFCDAFFQLPGDARDFVRKLLSEDPDERPSAHDALQHQWLRRVAGAEVAAALAEEQAQRLLTCLRKSRSCWEQDSPTSSVQSASPTSSSSIASPVSNGSLDSFTSWQRAVGTHVQAVPSCRRIDSFHQRQKSSHALLEDHAPTVVAVPSVRSGASVKTVNAQVADRRSAAMVAWNLCFTPLTCCLSEAVIGVYGLLSKA